MVGRVRPTKLTQVHVAGGGGATFFQFPEITAGSARPKHLQKIPDCDLWFLSRGAPAVKERGG